MPWKETNAMNEKIKFISAWLTDEYSLSELCRMFNISRVTGYKLINRYEYEGAEGLLERSRAHMNHPFKVSQDVEKIILNTKNRYTTWGPKKIRMWMLRNNPELKCPASSTIGDILKRHGLVKPRKKRYRTPPHSQPFINCDKPNSVWSADFKGYFRLGNKKLCYPLTVSDNYSRYLLECSCLSRPTHDFVKSGFDYIFREYGLPDAIKTDNGTPFASTSIGGLSRLSIWWIKLGIIPERIMPGCPEQNGRHERMHRTLKAAVAQPPQANLKKQQEYVDEFIKEYNYERPHEAINNLVPSDIYNKSLKPYPTKVPDVEYDTDLLVRRVRHNGEIRWLSRETYIGSVLKDEFIGLRQIEDHLWQVYFGPLYLGMINLHKNKIIRDN